MTRTGLFLYDLLKGTDVRKNLRFLRESQHWSLEELEKYQEDKLNRLLERVQVEVPYYQVPGTRSQEPGINILQILADLPIIDRKMTMDAGDKLLSTNINLQKCKTSRTGGTTGPPLRLYRDTETRSWALAAYYRFYEWMGIEPGMPEVELWGQTEIRDPRLETRNSKPTQHSTPNIQHPSIFDRISRFRSYNAFSFNDAYMAEVVRSLKRFQPKLIRGYLSAILLLTDYIKRNNVKGINPIAVSSTSETLFPEYRKKIEEIFQAPLYNQYGCGECNSIAFECKEHNGMHISMEHCILESDENNNLIVTNLDNYSQPFIRYKNGDIGEIDYTPCACGNNSPRLINLQGRANENVILKDGSSVNGIFFANLLDQSNFINSDKMLRFQVIQDREGEILFKAEGRRHMANGKREQETGKMKDKDIDKLKNALMPFFNKVVITQHDFLAPGPGGKFRYIISNL